ncbi:MAG TPA: hypothetical protein VEC93_10595, partial [Anaerolineae bacterium]|nr:hypothetical protein [Anaerolineae bacterium]
RFTFYVLRFWLGAIAVWGLVSLATFILLWPAMWVDPVGTFGQMWWETFSKVNEGHLVYFLGQPTLDPGPWFYPYVIPFRLTPVVLVGVVLSLLFFPQKFRAHLFIEPVVASRGHGVEPLGGPPAKASTPSSAISRTISQPGGFLLSPYFFLWLFVISLLLFGNLSPKKQDRYLLALFPFLNLLAACGWAGLIAMINDQLSMINRRITNYQLPITNYPSLVFNLSFLLLLLFQFIPVLTYYPYYLTYFNPLLGGPTRAAQTTLMGWGEGMEQVAAYLNQKPEAEKLYVASTPSQTLLPYFAGTGENFYTNDIAFRADYVVLYLAQMQRLAPSPEIVHYFES